MMTFRRFTAMTALVLVLCGVGALLPLVAGPHEPREVVVAAQKMAFYLGDDRTSANPVIRVAPGERVRFTLINADPGFEHDFAVNAWNLSTSSVHGEGRTSVIFQAPDQSGSAEYVCTMHAAMMKGIIEVTPAAQAAATLGR